MGFGEFVDGIGDFILPDQNRNLLQRTEDIFQKSLSGASLFGFKGDIADAQTALTGFDPFSGQRVSGVERWMSVLGVGALGGGVIGGARMADLGFPANSLLTRGRARPGDPSLATFDLTPGGRVAKETRAIDRALTRLNDDEGLTRPDTVFMTTRQKTNDILKLDLDVDLGGPLPERNGWRSMAAATEATSEGVPQTAGFLEGVLAPRLLEELPSMTAYAAQRIDNPDPHADLKAVAFMVAQWEFADAWDGFRFEGKVGPAALEEWHRLKRGEVVNSELLADSMAKFAVATDWIQDPELRLNPMVALSHINLDGDRAALSLKALQWQQVPLDRLTGRAVQERLRALVSMHPSNMVLLFKDNLQQLFEQAMRKPVDVEWQDWMTDMRHVPSGIQTEDPAELIRGWRDWYVNERNNLRTAAVDVRTRVPDGASHHFATEDQAAAWLTVVASITSAAEDWGTNIAKAETVAEYLYGSTRADTVAKMHSDLNALGIKMPKNDLVKILLLEGIDDPLEFFRTGAKGNVADPGMDLRQLEQMLDEGAAPSEIAHLRKLPKSWESQKQDSFAYALVKARQSDLEDRAHYLSELMNGELGSQFDYTPGGKVKVFTGTEARTVLPVVADRQHFKAAIGFSLVPDTWYASAGGSYDQFAHAARVLAAEMGDIDGRPVLPEEVQAITWMRYRAMSHYTDPLGRDWPVKADLDFDKAELGQTVGFRRPSTRTASWTDGHGGDLVFSNNILKYVTGEAVAPLPSTRFVDADTDLRRYRSDPGDLRPIDETVTKSDLEEVTLEVATDGSVKYLGDPGTLPRRGRVFSSAKHNGKQVLMPMRRTEVMDVSKEFEKINDTTRLPGDPNVRTGTGAMVHHDPAVRDKHPAFREGPMMSITSQSVFGGGGAPGDDLFGSSPRGVHARALRELRSRGINVSVEDLASHEGVSLTWRLPDGSEIRSPRRRSVPQPLPDRRRGL